LNIPFRIFWYELSGEDQANLNIPLRIFWHELPGEDPASLDIWFKIMALIIWKRLRKLNYLVQDILYGLPQED
jgi:hypothetical protein